jgi:hypothetical protein
MELGGLELRGLPMGGVVGPNEGDRFGLGLTKSRWYVGGLEGVKEGEDGDVDDPATDVECMNVNGEGEGGLEDFGVLCCCC